MFRWLSGNAIPPACDLRRCGWTLQSRGRAREPCVAIAHAASMVPFGGFGFLARNGPGVRARTLLIGVEDAAERAKLIGHGFGDVASGAMELVELDARAARIAELATMLPRSRQIGKVRLDLMARDGFADDKPLGLHPREFRLIWRLADTPGTHLTKRQLIEDVWRLGFVPETNSLAVHVSRLRAKLARAGLADIVETSASGSYRLKLPTSQDPPAIPLGSSDSGLDDYTRTGRQDAPNSVGP